MGRKPAFGVVAAVVWLTAVGCGRLGFDPLDSGSDADGAVDGGTGDWWDPAWGSRIRITWPDLVLPASAFPMPVRLNDARIDYARTSAGGSDLRFIDATGTTLAHEVESWEPTGESLVWVRVPPGATFVWMYFHNPSATDAQYPAALWSDHHAVWHLDATGEGTLDEFRDSTAGAHHGQGGGGDAGALPAPETGILDRAQRFDGGDDVIRITDSASFSFSTSAVTLEAWVNLDPAPRPEWGHMLSFNGYLEGYRFGVSGTDSMGFQVTGATHELSSAPILVANQWHYLVAVYDGTEMRIYIDGVRQPETTPRTGPIDPATAPVRLGNDASPEYAFSGLLDEARVSSAPRDDVYVAAQYRAVAQDPLIFTPE